MGKCLLYEIQLKKESIKTNYVNFCKCSAITLRYRGKTSRENETEPTFEEFVRYVTESHGRMDEHWAPIYNFCTPCSVNFTVIAKARMLVIFTKKTVHYKQVVYRL